MTPPSIAAKAAKPEVSVTELCADHANLREYIAQLESERDKLYLIGKAALDAVTARDACYSDDDMLHRNLRHITDERLRKLLVVISRWERPDLSAVAIVPAGVMEGVKEAIAACMSLDRCPACDWNRGEGHHPSCYLARGSAVLLAGEAPGVGVDGGWVKCSERMPPCPRGVDALGATVLIHPAPSDNGYPFAYYGRRATGKPAFYLHGAEIHGITHWRALPKGPLL